MKGGLCEQFPSRAGGHNLPSKTYRISGLGRLTRHRAQFGECLLLEVEPPFLPGTSPPLEAFFCLSTSTFLIVCLAPRRRGSPQQRGHFTMLNATR